MIIESTQQQSDNEATAANNSNLTASEYTDIKEIMSNTNITQQQP